MMLLRDANQWIMDSKNSTILSPRDQRQRGRTWVEKRGFRFSAERNEQRVDQMHRPLLVDNRHLDFVTSLSHQNFFFQALLTRDNHDFSSLTTRMFVERDPNFVKFLIGIFNFIKKGIDIKLDYSIHDYEIVSHAVVNRVVASTSWPTLPVTFFIAGAYLQHHMDQPTLDWSADNMVIWFFTDFAVAANNDRFVTKSQRRVLSGPSEFPAISLIVRLLWQAANPGSGSADVGSIRQWFSEVNPAPLTMRFLHDVELKPRRIDKEDSENGASDAGRDLNIGSFVDFGQHGNAHRFKLAGTWNAGEANFCWGRSPVALFAFTLRERPGPAILDVDLIVRDSRPDNPNRVAISCNGVKVFERPNMRSGPHRVYAPLERDLRVGRYVNVIGFHAPFFRPSDYFGDDHRDLGVAVQRLWIHEVA